MKNLKFLSLCIALYMSTNVIAQSLGTPAASPLQNLKQAFGTSEVSIEYSRPGAKGRKVFGNVVDYNKVWRTGANGSTKITFGDDVLFAGKAVKAGTYALYSIPSENNWDIMLYSDLKLGGNVAEYSTEYELLKVSIKPTKLMDMVETFTIGINNITSTTSNLDLLWENTKVSIPLETEIDNKIMKNIESILLTDKRPYYSAATYYYENNKDLSQAMSWVNTAIENNKTAYWIYLLKAKIAKKQNDYKTAIEAAKACNRLATEDKDDAYVKQSAEMLLSLKK